MIPCKALWDPPGRKNICIYFDRTRVFPSAGWTAGNPSAVGGSQLPKISPAGSSMGYALDTLPQDILCAKTGGYGGQHHMAAGYDHMGFGHANSQIMCVEEETEEERPDLQSDSGSGE